MAALDSRVPAARFRGCTELGELAGNCPGGDRTENGFVRQQSGYPSIPSGQCVVTSLCDLCLPQGYGVAYLVLENPRVPQKGVLGEFRGWM